MSGADCSVNRRAHARVLTVILLALAASVLPAAGGQMEVMASPTVVSDRVEVPLPPPARLGAAARSAEPVRADVLETPVTFSMVGFELPEGVDALRVRTSVDGEDWSPWVDTERIEVEDGPDDGSEEAAGDDSRSFAEPVWTEEANQLQVELPAGTDPAGELRAELIDTVGHNGQGVERRVVRSSGPEADAASRPGIISRAQWGANESWAGTPTYARGGVHMGVVHHTATSNSYSSGSAVMRSMYHYHTQSLGWKDLGYNIVIDRAGNVYEGRKGGLEAGVIGAHARNYNTGSFGVSVIGNYEQSNPTSASLRALEDVIAWQSRVYGIDPNGWTGKSGSTTQTIVGHRQVGQTSCPGRIQNHLPQLRENAARKAVPFPDVSGTHRAAVLQLADDGVINGCADNLFCPARGLTRGQMASLMARALDLKEQSSAQRFSDVPRNHPHRAGIHALVENGIVSGYPDGTYRPQNDVARDQMATFLANGLDLPRALYTGRFRDVGPLNSHARAVEAVAREEITFGCNRDGTLYCPGDTLRRDQAASLLHRGLYR